MDNTNKRKLPIKLLYVEDDPSIRESVQSLLLRRIEKVIFAENGLQGLNFFTEESPDVIITDIRMPEMDGIEMSTRIKELDPEAQIIIMSAFNDSDYLLKAINVGVNYYIMKPMDFNKLFTAIQKCEQFVSLKKENEHQRMRLLLAKEKAESAIKLKERIVKLIAHDLKSPFISIIQFLEVIKADETISQNESIKMILEAMYTKSTSQLKMIEDLLQYNRSHSDKLIAKCITVFPKSIADSSRIVFDLNLTKKNIQFNNLIASDFKIFADQVLILEVFKNILSNAIKFSFRNSSITIEAENDEKYDKIVFIDQGSGMDLGPDTDIFGINNHSQEGTDGESGHGFGLKFCKTIMDAHEGDIKIESKLGEGTKITLFFPKVNSGTLNSDN